MRIIVIGGSGHIGTYLIPMLIEKNHEVINITRGQRQPYLPHNAWKYVKHVIADRESEESAGEFGHHIRNLRPDVVIDLICFSLPSVKQLVESLEGRIQHFLYCGTIWVHGHTTVAPATEDLPRHPFGEYGIQKAQIEARLLHEARCNRFPATILHPGHIVGPGYNPLNPAGHFNLQAFAQLARGEELALPNLGLETVHHVHASDVAQAFMQALSHWNASIGESFHVVSPAAITLRGYAEAVSAWFGHEAKLKFMGWEQWKTTVSAEDANATWDHIAHSPNASIEKAKQFIRYAPAYTSLEAVKEALDWLIEHKKLPDLLGT